MYLLSAVSSYGRYILHKQGYDPKCLMAAGALKGPLYYAGWQYMKGVDYGKSINEPIEYAEILPPVEWVPAPDASEIRIQY